MSGLGRQAGAAREEADWLNGNRRGGGRRNGRAVGDGKVFKPRESGVHFWGDFSVGG